MIAASLLLLLSAAEPIQIDAAKVVWQDAPPSMPKGTQMAVLEGDPKKEGIFTIRLKAPKGFFLDVHTHPADERVTVIDGKIAVGFGKTVDKNKARTFSAGAFYVNPKGEEHFVFSDEGAVVQITGLGPWKVEPKPAAKVEAKPEPKPEPKSPPSAPATSP